jgi:hypothetical protein
LENLEISYNGEILSEDAEIVVAMNSNGSLKANATVVAKFELMNENAESPSKAQVYTFVPDTLGNLPYVTIGNNDIGTGIKSLNFKVYDRLGKVVFETDKWFERNSTNDSIGWDGFYKGKLQNSGNYTWLLSVTFIDCSAKTNRGNVLLSY